jgi:hypothetical protein
MNRFTVGDLVKVIQPGSIPKMGFIDSITEGLYKIQYLDATVEDNVDIGRLKKQSMSATVHERPALITDRRMVDGKTKYSVNFTDSWNDNPERVAMVDISEIGPPSPSKGGRTRRYKKAKKSKKSKKRTRRR